MTDTGYHPQTGTIHAAINWNQSDPILSSLLETVSVATDTEPENLPQLHTVLDIEAVEDLLVPHQSQTQVIDASVKFKYANCTITVSYDGSIVVDPPESGSHSPPRE